MERITFELDNREDLNLLISIAKKLGLKKIIHSDTGTKKRIELKKGYKIIDAGADISSFGDVKELAENYQSALTIPNTRG